MKNIIFFLFLLVYSLPSCVYTEKASQYFLTSINKKKEYLQNAIRLEGFYYSKKDDRHFYPIIFYQNGLVAYSENPFNLSNLNYIYWNNTILRLFFKVYYAQID
jgi:hypothetical protein